MASIIPDDEPHNPTERALGEYRRIIWLAQDGARAAEKIPSLPPHYRELATAIRNLCGFRPHTITGAAEQEDATKLVNNLDFACEVLDPLIEVFGDYAALHFSGIDKKQFKDVLRSALEGKALYEIESAGKRATRDIALHA